MGGTSITRARKNHPPRRILITQPGGNSRKERPRLSESYLWTKTTGKNRRNKLAAVSFE